MKLPNGTLWPDLHRAGEVAHALRYSDALTQVERYVAAEVIEAYLHLTTHPVGTEACVRTLRALRRAARMAADDDAPPEADPALLAAGNRALVEQVEQLRARVRELEAPGECQSVHKLRALLARWHSTADEEGVCLGLIKETRAVLGLVEEER